jgi:cytochrome c oxidase assembly protein subunit 11
MRPNPSPRVSNRVTGVVVAAIVLGMVGLSFAAIPLYRVFCEATGYAGTPKIGVAAAPGGNGQTIRVRFNANTNPGLPWQFAPDVSEMTVPLGEDHLASYHAHNKANRTVTGVALYNVTPEKAAKYFHKTACFCFNEQTLEPHADASFPLSFWVDPAITRDPNTADVHDIVLSYTFYKALDDAEKSGALAKAGPHVGPAPVTN